MNTKIEITVTFSVVGAYKFRTVESPYSFTLNKRIYEAEYILIKNALNNAGVNHLNVTSCVYECGLFRPFGTMLLPIVMKMDGYRIIIHAYASSQKAITKSLKDTIREKFMIVRTLEEKKTLYRELIKQHHPDKEGGNTEIAKFINSFKNW